MNKNFPGPARFVSRKMATDEMYLENLEQWIHEEGKLVSITVTFLTFQVTYHTLSNQLQVPVDVAKQ